MWKKVLSLAAAVTVMALVGGTWLAPHRAVADSPAATEHTLTVSGSGTVSVIPDTAVITLGFSIKSGTADAAMNAGNTAMDNILGALTAKGASEDQIKTTQYYLAPNYNYDEKTHTQLLDGYTFSESMQITVKDLKKVGVMIDAAAGAGANRVDGIQYTVADQRTAQVNAIKVAVDDAKAKAQATATQLGVNLGSAIKVDVSSGGSPGPVFYKTAAADSRAISAGTVDVGVTVTVTYNLP